VVLGPPAVDDAPAVSARPEHAGLRPCADGCGLLPRKGDRCGNSKAHCGKGGKGAGGCEETPRGATRGVGPSVRGAGPTW
jgi:hypothetical protein